MDWRVEPYSWVLAIALACAAATAFIALAHALQHLSFTMG